MINVKLVVIGNYVGEGVRQFWYLIHWGYGLFFLWMQVPVLKR